MIPQLADAAEVLERIDVPEGVSVGVLVPNERGLDGARWSTARRSTRSTCSCRPRRPTTARTSTARSPSRCGALETVLARAQAAGLRCEGVISTSFGCPYEGRVPAERVLEIATPSARRRRQEIGFGDTTGMANPLQVRRFFTAARERLGGPAAASRS